MKAPKGKDNPFGVSIGKVYKRKRKDRPNKFTVIEFEKDGSFFAVVEYGKGKNKYIRKINLANFGEYQLVK